MKRLLLALMLCAGQISAQEMTVETCKATAAAVFEFAGLEVGSPTLASDGDCLLLDQVVFDDDTLLFRVDQLRWSASDVGRFLDEGLPPTALNVEFDGLRPVIETGDVVLDYIMAVQRNRGGIDGTLDLVWDQAADALMLNQFDLNFGSLGHVKVSGQIDHVNLQDIGALQTSFGSAGVTRLAAEVRTTGLFEEYLLVSLGHIVLRDEADPARATAIIKNHTIAAIKDIQSEALAADSKEALVAVVETLPNPNGTLRLSATSEAGLGMAQVTPTFVFGVPANADNALEYLPDLKLSVDWTPLP